MSYASVRYGLAFLSLVLIFAPPGAAADDPPPSSLSEDERQTLLDLLDQSEAMLLGVLAGVSDAQWSFKPAPERWSVGECAEHIMRSNQALFSSAQAALAADPDPEWFDKTKGKSELLMQVMPNRRPGGGGATAPQEIRPTGEFSRAQIVAQFRELYGTIREFVEDMDRPLKEHLEAHPFEFFDPLNAYQWTIYVPLHTIRHTKQLIEVMETPGYPAS